MTNFNSSLQQDNKFFKKVYGERIPTPDDETIFEEIRNGNYSNTHKLTTLSDEIADKLSKQEMNISLDSLTSLSDLAAKSFIKHKGELSFLSLSFVSPTAVSYLAEHKKKIWLKQNTGNIWDELNFK